MLRKTRYTVATLFIALVAICGQAGGALATEPGVPDDVQKGVPDEIQT